MPIYESYCSNEQCAKYEEPFEWMGLHCDCDPFCKVCGYITTRMVSRFAVTFTGVMSASKYNVDTPGGNPAERHMDGHWVTRKRSSKTGKPEREFITTFEQQAKYCKEEGLVNPRDVDVSKIEGRPNGKWTGDV